MSTDFKSLARDGLRSKEYRLHVAPDRIGAFSGAVHAQDRGEAPPTFLTIARDGEFELLQVLGLPLKNILHAEQEYEYEAPLLAGDELVYSTSLAQVLEKKGGSGSMTFFILETVFEAERGGNRMRVGRARTNLLTRG